MKAFQHENRGEKEIIDMIITVENEGLKGQSLPYEVVLCLEIQDFICRSILKSNNMILDFAEIN